VKVLYLGVPVVLFVNLVLKGYHPKQISLLFRSTVLVKIMLTLLDYFSPVDRRTPRVTGYTGAKQRVAANLMEV
jgi:hypothetical protein